MRRKTFLKRFATLLLLLAAVFFLYCNNTSLIGPQTVRFYETLKDSLKQRGLSTRLLVISTKRFRWHNAVQLQYAGAANRIMNFFTERPTQALCS